MAMDNATIGECRYYISRINHTLNGAEPRVCNSEFRTIIRGICKIVC
ncbi:MAG: hypothetical protein IJO63_02630 [Bacilli bacterium]|nr:hypothetical protein [Bacilli bacterium]